MKAMTNKSNPLPSSMWADTIPPDVKARLNDGQVRQKYTFVYGNPSWHQRRAGSCAAGTYTDWYTEQELQVAWDNAKKHGPVILLKEK